MSDEQDYQDYLEYQQYLASQQPTTPEADTAGFSPSQLAAASVLKTTRAAIPFADEAVSGIGALVQALGGAEQPIGDLYSSNLSQIDQGIKAYETQNPTLSKLSTAAGVPVNIATLSAALKGAQALPYVGGALAPVEGAGITPALQRIAQALGVGATTGAISGADEAAPGERLAGAGSGAKFGALVGGGLQGGLELVAPLAKPMLEAGGKLARSSLGARQTDYTKSANRLGILHDATEDEVQTFTKKTLDDLIESGALGSSREPSKLLATATKAESGLENEIGDMVRAFDRVSKTSIKPEFKHSIELLESGAIPGDKIAAFARRISKIERAIADGGGKLSYVQKQKIGVGKDWSLDDSIKNDFTRALYRDLQETIEKAIPDVVPLNRELQKYKVVSPILQRGLAASEGEDVVRKLTSAMRTSGGFGVPFLGLSYLGAPGAGLAVGGTLAALQTQQGKRLAGEALKKAAPAVASHGGEYSKLISALAGDYLTPKL